MIIQPLRKVSTLTFALPAALVLTPTLWPSVTAAEDTTWLARMLRESRSVEVRARAANALGRRREATKRPELEGALADTHPDVRAAAAKALGQIGSRESLSPLHEVTRDRVKTVAASARDAIQNIETQTPAQPTSTPLVKDAQRERLGFQLGYMRAQSAWGESELARALGHSVERVLQGFSALSVFAANHAEQLHAAQARGLEVFRLDGIVTALSGTNEEGQLSMHCEVLLLVMERPTGLLRTVLKGAARGTEVPNGELAAQQRSMAPRVVDAAVRSALRDADASLQRVLQNQRPRAASTAARGATVAPSAPSRAP